MPESKKSVDNREKQQPKGKIGCLSIYRMQLLGEAGMRRYRETGYIPPDLID